MITTNAACSGTPASAPNATRWSADDVQCLLAAMRQAVAETSSYVERYRRAASGEGAREQGAARHA